VEHLDGVKEFKLENYEELGTIIRIGIERCHGLGYLNTGIKRIACY